MRRGIGNKNKTKQNKNERIKTKKRQWLKHSSTVSEARENNGL